MNKLKKIKYKKERCILSDTLPFEVPIIFNNNYYYNFILKNKIEFDSKLGKISWVNIGNSDALDNLIKILFNLKDNNCFNKNKSNRYYQKKKFSGITIPYNYKISHPSNVFRELSIPHPLTQLMIVDFYERNKELILYYCSLSSFSIRKPIKIAQYLFHKDKTHYSQLADNFDSSLEMNEKEFENLKSFFVYGDISNIHAFYDSTLFHEQEKKYNHLIKLDISKCFDSIYTHSISWAISGMRQTKESINSSNNTLAGEFDSLMQKSNYNETNGIIIGPELSRIFAEIILQSIDVDIKLILADSGLLENIHYNIFRYIDDYFVFYNDIQHKEILTNTIQESLKKYKLNLNSSKLVEYQKPIITDMSIAKTKISSILNDRLAFNLEIVETEEKEKLFKGSIFIKSNTLIRDFKIAMKESNMEYKSILNYTLSIIEKKIESILKNYNKVSQQYKKQEDFIVALNEILNFSFFVYAISPQVNPTIRLSRIIGKIIFFLKNSNLNEENKNIIKHFLYENICLILNTHRIKKHTQIETIYLLLGIAELGKEYLVSEEILISYFTIDFQDKKNLDLNYFVLISILFYIKNKKIYKNLYKFVMEIIELKINNNHDGKNTESILLLMDVLSCPYINIDFKKKILKDNYKINDPALLNDMCNYKIKNWFTVWKNFSFLKALYDKHSKEVY